MQKLSSLLSLSVFLISTPPLAAQSEAQGTAPATIQNKEEHIKQTREQSYYRDKISLLEDQYQISKERQHQSIESQKHFQTRLQAELSDYKKQLDKNYSDLIAQLQAQQKQSALQAKEAQEANQTLSDKIEDMRSWTDSIIVFWSTMCALVVTGFGIAVPLITQRKYAEKLDKNMKEELAYLDLKARSMVTNNKSEKMDLYDNMIALKPKEYIVYTMRADLKLELGSYHDARRDYDKAITVAESLLGTDLAMIKDLDLAYIHWRKGSAASSFSHYDHAKESLEQALELSPHYADALVSLGHLHYNTGEKETAKEYYKKAKKYSKPDSYSYFMSSAHLEREHGDYDRAIVLFTRAIDIHPTSSSAFLGRGNAYSDKADGDPSSKFFRCAEADYTKAIRLNPKSATIYNNRGNLYTNLGERDNAILDYNMALEINPKYAMAYKNRGLLYSNLGERDNAMLDYNMALEINPKYADVYNNRGNLYEDLGERDNAMLDYNMAIKLDPNNAVMYSNRARLHQQLNDLPSAIKDYIHSIACDHSNTSAYHELIDLCDQTELYSVAIDAYTEVIDQHLNESWGYLHRALIHEKKTDDQAAIADYTTAITLKPTETEALERRAALYAKHNKLDPAIQDYSSLIAMGIKHAAQYERLGHANWRQSLLYKREPEAIYASWHQQRALVYEKQGMLTEAIKDYTTALTLQPEDAMLYYERGQLHKKQGTTDSMEQDYAQAIALDPSLKERIEGENPPALPPATP